MDENLVKEARQYVKEAMESKNAFNIDLKAYKLIIRLAKKIEDLENDKTLKN
tara:strand:- start:1638 stop:1793 length:156 start_codon:yes stop_codon:yes gene_type:complete